MSLPADLQPGQRGRVRGGGWTIAYVVRRADESLCVDLYACHTLSGCRLVRIHSDGRSELVGSAGDWWPVADDPREQVRLDGLMADRQRRFDRDLAKRGLYDLAFRG